MWDCKGICTCNIAIINSIDNYFRIDFLLLEKKANAWNKPVQQKSRPIFVRKFFKDYKLSDLFKDRISDLSQRFLLRISRWKNILSRIKIDQNFKWFYNFDFINSSIIMHIQCLENIRVFFINAFICKLKAKWSKYTYEWICEYFP